MDIPELRYADIGITAPGVSQQRAWSASPPGLQHLPDVVECGRGADVAAQDGQAAVAG
jgi:hypothetical protein